MFESAIEEVLQYTRPLHSISRSYKGLISPGTSTFFFVNDKGVAITCKHVLELIPTADKINRSFQLFKQEMARLPQNQNFKALLQQLEKKYQYKAGTTIQLKNNFLNCFDKIDEIVGHTHPTLDLAILEFKGFNRILYTSHARFIKDSSTIKQGKYLCRTGFPFPEFNNFRYNEMTDDIEWTNTGNPNSPSFPIDGIVTRFLGDPITGSLSGIEMSTPSLKGQSGGPLFDSNGIVYGMQYATNHLHLGFDINEREVFHEGGLKKVSNYPFLHVGLCVHADRIKDFLRQHQIEFTEE